MADIVYTKTKVIVPPVGPFYKLGTNPIIPNTNPLHTGYLPENVVYDPVTAKYWVSMASGASTTGLGLASSTNLVTWTIEVPTLTLDPGVASSGGSHLIFDGGLWYLFYGKVSGPKTNTYYATSTVITGPYLGETLALSAGASGWDVFRAYEVFVFHDASQYVMFYMGDAGPAFANLEQIGYATAPAITGPWTKYAGNPVIPFGAPGSFDGGVVADPSVLKVDGTYYIVYSCGPNLGPPHTSALVTTTDLINFTKRGTILPRGSNNFEDSGVVRGAVQRFGDFYYYIYGGSHGTPVTNYQPCMAIAPATQATLNAWTKATP